MDRHEKVVHYGNESKEKRKLPLPQTDMLVSISGLKFESRYVDTI